MARTLPVRVNPGVGADVLRGTKEAFWGVVVDPTAGHLGLQLRRHVDGLRVHQRLRLASILHAPGADGVAVVGDTGELCESHGQLIRRDVEQEGAVSPVLIQVTSHR